MARHPQCKEPKKVLDTVFYCIGNAGHQHPHYWNVSMSDLERLLDKQREITLKEVGLIP